MNNTVSINKYLPIAAIYFFFNSFLLPLGLLYTTLLTPLLLLWLYKYPTFNYLIIFFILSAPFAVVHLLNGVNIYVYIKSYTLLFTVFVFGLAFYQFLKKCNSLRNIFKWLAILNFILVLMAVSWFLIPFLRDIVWFHNNITSGFEQVYRLKLFTYEASYYSFLLVPIALYFYLKSVLFTLPNKWVTFWLITLPLLLSLSFGVIAALLITMALIFCSDIRLFTINRKYPRFMIITLAVVLIGLLLFINIFPENVVLIRIENIFKGRDTSFSGRTFDAMYLGWKVAAQKSILFGAGPGQLKFLGVDLFNQFYRTDTFTPAGIAIPNSAGDMLATFGIMGLLIKLSLEVYLFFRTRVYQNLYRLSLFLFMFIYQFTGSFITNIAEYVIWILAFSLALFPEFNKVRVFEHTADPVEREFHETNPT